MSEKGKNIVTAIAVGCCTVTGFEIAMLIAKYILEGPSEELLDHTLALITIFFWGMICFLVFYKVFIKLASRKLDINKRKKMVSTQIYIITTIIAIIIICDVIFIVKKYTVGIFFSSGFLFAILFWEIGCVLANKLLEKDVEDINEKLKEKKSK